MTSMSETYKDVGSSPLQEGAPEPAWVRDDSPEFARINAEIAKLESLSAAEEPDWIALIKTAGELVKDKSKDLLAISYLGRALFERERYEGLAAALQVLDDVVEQSWETAFPPAPRAKRRGNEIAWLIDKLVNPVTQLKPASTEAEAVFRATELLLGLEAKLTAKLEDHAPIFRELREVLVGYRDQLAAAETERKAQEAKRAAAEAASESATVTSSPSEAGTQHPAEATRRHPEAAAAALSAPVPVAVGSDNEVRKAVKETRRAVQQIAAYWRSKRLSDPRPYVILRFAAWMDVAAPPQIPLPGPTKNMVAECKRLLEEGSHRELIEYAESILLNPEAPPNCHWLDCHRYTVTALTELGVEYQPARNAVIRALRHYLASFPGTLDMTFNTEVEYADAQTKAWIRSEVMTGEPGASAADAPTAVGSDLASALADAVKQARARAAKGDSHAAVGVFQERLGVSGSGREAFALALEQARFCLELGYAEVAASVLEGLRQKTDYHHLDEWEPELSVETIKLLLKTLDTPTAADQPRLTELRSRLARLDAVAAMEALRSR